MAKNYIIKNIPPGPKGSFLLGSTKDFASDTLGFVSDCQRRYQDIAKAKIAFRDFYILFKPEFIHYILEANHRNYIKSFAYTGFKKILGNGLLTSEGDFWRKQRRLAQPAFHKENLNVLLSLMQGPMDNLIQEWKDKSGDSVNFTLAMRGLTQQLVSVSLFGSSLKLSSDKLGWMLDQLRKYANDKMKNPFKAPLFVPTKSNREFNQAMEKLDDVIYSIIEERNTSSTDIKDLLSMLIDVKDENGVGMNKRQIRDEVTTVFIAGQETASNALCFIFYLLGKYPESVLRMKEEVKSVLKEGNTVSLETVSKLEYTTWVIKEAMRLFPPAWAISRQAVKEDSIGDYYIPAGATIFLSIYAMHRDPRYWGNPEDFIPERFSPDNFTADQKKAYLPFGSGARICIGNNFAMMEMQLIVALLIKNFNFKIDPQFKPILKTPVTLGFKNDLYLSIEKN